MYVFGDFAECRARSRVLPREPVGHVEMLSEMKKHRIPSGILCLLVAETGFEPRDLRVMSPTSYQAALLRDIYFTRLSA